MRRKKGAIKSRGEKRTDVLLKGYLRGKPFIVLKDVALNQVIEPDGSKLSARDFDYYTRASLDFLVCHDNQDQEFGLAIEYDGAGHEDPQQAGETP